MNLFWLIVLQEDGIVEITNLSLLIGLLSIPNSDFEFGENKLIRCVCWRWSTVIKRRLYETM